MAGVIDVSTLPLRAVLDTSYEAAKAARLASLKVRYAAAGIPWDVDALETDPGVILQEEDAYREILDRGAINDSIRRVLPAFAFGADLDHLVALNNTRRLVITPADPANAVAAVDESDAALLRRYLASFSLPGAGSEDGYIARALAAYPAARDIRVYKSVIDGAPRVNVVLLGPDGQDVPTATLAAVYAALSARDAAPLTAAISVRAATLVPWTFRARLTIPRGPSPDAVVAQARAALAAMADARFHIGGAVPPNAPAGALYVPNVLRVDPLDPFAGIDATDDGAPLLDLAGVELQTVLA